MIIFYNILLMLGTLALSPFLIPVLMASNKRRKTLLKRLGAASLPQHATAGASRVSTLRPIWVHALSVGEVISAVPLLKAMVRAYPRRDIVFSASTLTGFEIARRRIGQDVLAVFYYPYDFIFSVKRVAGAVNPALVVIVESDVWPNFVTEMKKRSVPVVLVNARLSNRSFRGHRRLNLFAFQLFSKLDRICTQTQADVDRFLQLGILPGSVMRTGNIKFDQGKGGVEPEKKKRLASLFYSRPKAPVFVAGSTHEGEEAVLLEAYSIIRKQFPRLVMVLAPRDPGRAPSVCRISKAAGYTAILLGEMIGKKTNIAVVDTIGDLATLYGLADIAFIGGSLVKEGGHNPLEPACLSKPVLFGPDMTDFLEISKMLITGGGAFRVTDADAIAGQAVALLKEPERMQRIGMNARAVYRKNSGAVERTLKEIKDTLPP